MPALDLTVVTASRGRHDALLRKARALQRQTLAPDRFEWCIWLNEDDAALRELRQRLKPQSWPFRVVLMGGEDLPVGRARNRAAAAAQGQVLLLSDDDCRPAAGALTAHLALHQAQPNSVGNGPLRLPEALRNGRLREPFERPLRLPGGRSSWLNFTGANSSLPAAAYRNVGGYDEDWHGYGGEDPELALRLAAQGLRFLQVPSGDAEHDGRVWDDNAKAYAAGAAHVRVARRYPESGAAWALGVHPLLLTAKRLWLYGPAARFTNDVVLAYERAYARGARDAHEEPR